MEKRNLTEIAQMSLSDLKFINDFWQDYDVETVLFAYAELKRRDYMFNNKNIRRFNAFVEKNRITDIESSLSEVFKSLGYNSYNEYYEKGIGEIEKVTSAQFAPLKNENDKYPALRAIITIYKIFGILIVFVAIFTAYVLGKENLTFGLITIIVGALMVLGVFAVAESIMVFIDIEHNTRKNARK